VGISEIEGTGLENESVPTERGKSGSMGESEELGEAGQASSEDVRQEERRLCKEELECAILEESEELEVYLVTVSLSIEASADV